MVVSDLVGKPEDRFYRDAAHFPMFNQRKMKKNWPYTSFQGLDCRTCGSH